MRPHTTGRMTLALSMLAGFRGATLGALLALTIAVAIGAGADPVVRRTPTQDAYSRLVNRAGLECSSVADTRTPNAAVIRLPDGTLKAVSFERGWAVYTGKRPGKLVAVCVTAFPDPSPS